MMPTAGVRDSGFGLFMTRATWMTAFTGPGFLTSMYDLVDQHPRFIQPMQGLLGQLEDQLSLPVRMLTSGAELLRGRMSFDVEFDHLVKRHARLKQQWYRLNALAILSKQGPLNIVQYNVAIDAFNQDPLSLPGVDSLEKLKINADEMRDGFPLPSAQSMLLRLKHFLSIMTSFNEGRSHDVLTQKTKLFDAGNLLGQLEMMLSVKTQKATAEYLLISLCRRMLDSDESNKDFKDEFLGALQQKVDTLRFVNLPNIAPKRDQLVEKQNAGDLIGALEGG